MRTFSYAQDYLYKNRVPAFTGVQKEMKHTMRNILKNRLALSTVITTLIILVVAVLLAGVVTYFAINVVSTRVQQESLSITQTHIWVNATSDASEGALMITNTGGRDVVISQLQVRGQQCKWSNVFYLTALSNDSGLTSPLRYNGTVGAGMQTGFANPLVVAPTVGLTLPSGDSMVVYVTSPDSVTINDVGLTVGFTVFTSQAMYYQETNVQATS